ncbi:endochitinase A isoform X1 [Oryza sativa Japonica Group]|nr:unnamed protein product [Oryza sativa Japonica Group]
MRGRGERGDLAGDGPTTAAVTSGGRSSALTIDLPPLLPSPAGISKLRLPSPARALNLSQVRPGEAFQNLILHLFHCPVTPIATTLGPSKIIPTPIWLCAAPSKPLNSLYVKNALNFWFSSSFSSFSVSSLGFGLFLSHVANKDVATSLFLAGSSVLKSAGLSIHLTKDSAAKDIQENVTRFLVQFEGSSSVPSLVGEKVVPALQTVKPAFTATSRHIGCSQQSSKTSTPSVPTGPALKSVYCPVTNSFRDALLSQPKPKPPARSATSRLPSRGRKNLTMLNRCFRCLGSDHQVKDCRDPLICASCRRAGHRQDSCRSSMASNISPRRSSSSFHPSTANSTSRFTTRWVRRALNTPAPPPPRLPTAPYPRSNHSSPPPDNLAIVPYVPPLTHVDAQLEDVIAMLESSLCSSPVRSVTAGPLVPMEVSENAVTSSVASPLPDVRNALVCVQDSSISVAALVPVLACAVNDLETVSTEVVPATVSLVSVMPTRAAAVAEVAHATVESVVVPSSVSEDLSPAVNLSSMPPRLRCKNKGFLAWYGACPSSRQPSSVPPQEPRDIFVCSEQLSANPILSPPQDPDSTRSPPPTLSGPSAAEQIRRALAGLSPEGSIHSASLSPGRVPVITSNDTTAAQDFAFGEPDPVNISGDSDDDILDIFIPFVDMRVTAHYATAYVTPPCECPGRVIRKAMQDAHPRFQFTLISACRGAMTLRFIHSQDRDFAVDHQENLTAEGHLVRLERPEDSAARFIQHNTMLSELDCIDFPPEMLFPNKIRNAFENYGELMEVDDQCLYGDEQSSLRLVVLHYPGKRMSPRFRLRYNLGIVCTVYVRVLRTWELAMNVDEDGNYIKHYEQFLFPHQLDPPRSGPTVGPEAELDNLNQAPSNQISNNQGLQNRGRLLAILPAASTVFIEEISDTPEIFVPPSIHSAPSSIHDCLQDLVPSDTENEHELSARKRRRQKKRTIDSDVKRRYSERLAAKEGHLYISMESKAARAKKLKEQLAKCSSKLNDAVHKHNLLDLNFKTTPKALEDLAIACSLNDHDIAQLRKVFSSVD